MKTFSASLKEEGVLSDEENAKVAANTRELAKIYEPILAEAKDKFKDALSGDDGVLTEALSDLIIAIVEYKTLAAITALEIPFSRLGNCVEELVEGYGQLAQGIEHAYDGIKIVGDEVFGTNSSEVKEPQ